MLFALLRDVRCYLGHSCDENPWINSLLQAPGTIAPGVGPLTAPDWGIASFFLIALGIFSSHHIYTRIENLIYSHYEWNFFFSYSKEEKQE